ncbi:MAG: DEAD/DEAH box helicase [Chloroflexota bacterium]
MNILHAQWIPPTTPNESGQICLWSETSDLPQLKKIDRRKKGARLHPFVVNSEQVVDLLHSQILENLSGKAGQIAMLLPAGKYGPLPSPQLIHEWDIRDQGKVDLRPWLVNGFMVEPQDAIHLLSGLLSEQDLPPQFALGTDTRYWQTATELLLEAITQHKVLPTLAPIDVAKKHFHARWMPVLDGPRDGPRMAQLISAMPPLCRATGNEAVAALPPRQLLTTFLNVMGDAAMREWGRSTVSARSLPSGPAGNWLKALTADDPTIKGSAAQLNRLHSSHQAWLRNLYAAGDKNFRIGFRLEAPLQNKANEPSSFGRAKGRKKGSKQGRAKDDARDWGLHFLLQARDDPSLLASASEVWAGNGQAFQLLDRRFDQPQQKLLTGLGFATRLFPPLERGLQTSQPTEVMLTADEAYSFLRETAPLLVDSGFAVLSPPWWNQPGTRLGVRLQMQNRQGTSAGADVVPGASGVSMDSLISYKWKLSVGDAELTKEEFEALVALKSPLVQIRGQWVQLDPERIEAAIRFWENQDTEGSAGLQEAMRMGLGADEVDGLPVEGVDTDEWVSDWMDRLTGGESMTLLDQPTSLRATLRPYQQYGYSWLGFLKEWGMGACLADDMGLGKTIQTLSMILKDKENLGELPGPILLICPTSVVTNWAKEAEKFAPDLRIHTHQGSNRLKGDEFIEETKEVHMVLTSYPLMRRDSETIQQIQWYGVILDEAQNIKNAQTQQARAIRSLSTDFRLALTGTPVENRLSELWSIMHFLNPGYLGNRSDFRNRFAVPIERYADEGATRRLRQLTTPFILRRLKTDPTVIQDLPDKVEMKAYANLTTEQATLYESVVREAMETIEASEGIERRGLVLGMLTRLKQICNHPAQFLHQVGDEQSQSATVSYLDEEVRSGKLIRLVEQLEMVLAVDERALIFTQFAEMGHLLRAFLQQRLGVNVLFLHGGTPARRRNEMIERFQGDEDGPSIFILSLKAGGTGITLTRANHVFHFDRWWNPAVEDQATDRAFRIGQKKNVQVHKYICTGTLEEKIDTMIDNKKALAESIVGGDESWLTELSTDDLRDMVELRRDVLSDE